MTQSQKHPPRLHDMEGHIAAKGFISALFHQLNTTVVPEDSEYALLRKIENQIKKNPGTAIPAHHAPPSKTATRFWHGLLKNASGDGAAEIASELHKLEPFISWINEPNYRGHEIIDTFHDIYACFEVVGSNGFFMHDKITIGFMLLGPEFYYPSHSHPDFECIYAFSGRSTWHMENGPIISIPAGARIFIPPDKAHTFWTMDQAFAGIYLCLKG